MRKKLSVCALIALLTMSFSLTLTGCGSSTSESSDKKIVVGCMDTYTPYAYVDDEGNAAGYDVEVMREAAKRAGYEIEFVSTDWDSLFPGLDSGKWDCVANQLGRTDERVELYNMGNVPYFQNSMKLVVGADSDVTGIDDLKGAKIDCITGDYATGLLEDYLKENPGAFEIVYTEGTMAMILEDIVNGRVAGNVNDPFTINTTAEENKISDKVKLVGDELFSDYVFAAFAKTDEGAQMRDDFDEAIQSMIEDGTLEEMSNNTFNYNYNGTIKDGIVK